MVRSLAGLNEVILEDGSEEKVRRVRRGQTSER
jgi:hypothetical protein